MQVALGLGMVFLLYAVAQALQLVTVLTITSALIQSVILVVVVVFANDIRRALQRVGSRAWFGGMARAQETRVIDEVVEAATELARHRTGALITFEQDANLDEFVGVHKGHLLDAQVSKELLVSLFVPEGMNKLHDGSVIIRNYRVAKAGVFFPMPEGRVVDESFGSRHRAAMGITEETDAVVVIVSEERGTISFCFNGNIASNLDGPKLKTMLEAIFSPKVRRKSRRAQRKSEAGAPPKAPLLRRDSETRVPLKSGDSEQRTSEVDIKRPAQRPSEPPPAPAPEGRPSRTGSEPLTPLRPRGPEAEARPRLNVTPTPAQRLMTPPSPEPARSGETETTPLSNPEPPLGDGGGDT
jgi:uncharacterized protein (TIGR00159 family)